MSERTFNWRNNDIRTQIDVVDSKLVPTLLLTNGLVLNPFLKQWVKANIWIHDDRIVYVGAELPQNKSAKRVIDCEGKYIVPGYIEPHAHPFHIYNPQSLAEYVSQFGTTTMVSDNLFLLLQSNEKKALSTLCELKSSHFSISGGPDTIFKRKSDMKMRCCQSTTGRNGLIILTSSKAAN